MTVPVPGLPRAWRAASAALAAGSPRPPETEYRQARQDLDDDVLAALTTAGDGASCVTLALVRASLADGRDGTPASGRPRRSRRSRRGAPRTPDRVVRTLGRAAVALQPPTSADEPGSSWTRVHPLADDVLAVLLAGVPAALAWAALEAATASAAGDDLALDVRVGVAHVEGIPAGATAHRSSWDAVDALVAAADVALHRARDLTGAAVYPPVPACAWCASAEFAAPAAAPAAAVPVPRPGPDAAQADDSSASVSRSAAV